LQVRRPGSRTFKLANAAGLMLHSDRFVFET
jgi:hypothetical protein